ncbi:DUF2513 domain-containing protein [Kurthia sp. Dielmo]|uniref:DUF2513 domain-containing protein n=1 Tax=Kurthia sp. Dielmo TaxID=1033738 RepID=UPI00112237E5|nr:DUF2513 domain-containing protein [Kurthia sp. Dielmo]
MIRDMNFVRELLDEIAKGKERGVFHKEDAPEKTILSLDNKENYHLEILRQAGLIDWYEKPAYRNSGQLYDNIRLTWEGQEYYALTKNFDVWMQVEAHLKTCGLRVEEVSFEMLKDLATQKLRQTIGLK